MDNTQIFEMADRLKAAKELKKGLDEQTKSVNAEIEQIDRELSNAMAEQELDKFTRNGSTFYLNSRLYASPAAGRKEDMFAALKANGYGALVTETVNANTLASFCKEQLTANDDELPSWLAKVVAFDYETAPDDGYRNEDKAALDAAKSHICTLSLSVKAHTGIMIPVAHKVGVNMPKDQIEALLREFLSDRTITKVAYNLSFEAMFSYAKGIVIMPPVYDTIAASQMTLKNAYDFRKLADSGLKKLAGELCGEPLPSFTSVTDGKHFDELDPMNAETIRYSCADSDFALRLYHIFNDWFDTYLPKHRTLVEQVESPTAVYLGIMKYNGVPMNLPLMQERKAEADAEMERIRGEIAFMIWDVNIGSNCSTNAFKSYLFKDLGLPVLKTTESNREAADDATMILLKEWCDKNRPELSHLFELVQEYRKWNKITSTYIDGYMKYINSATGRIHPNFYALSTDTGRFSCNSPKRS